MATPMIKRNEQYVLLEKLNFSTFLENVEIQNQNNLFLMNTSSAEVLKLIK